MSHFKFPSFKEVGFAFESLTIRQKTIFLILLAVFAMSTFVIFWKVNAKLMINIPVSGGSLQEGIIGSPRFINPLLAISDTDRDLTMLTYSGLMRIGKNSSLIPDLAENFTISDDGLTYTFKLKNNLTWQDDQKITADDIIFTINTAQDPSIKSAKRAGWSGVVVRKIDDQNIEFVLKKPYGSFLENTTLGILPKHLWGKITPENFPLSDLNNKPVGSGPYTVDSINKNSSGIAESYVLKPFTNFALGEPKIKSLTVSFFANDVELTSAYKAGRIDSLSALSPQLASELEKSGQKITASPLPRTFAIFLNSGHAQIFADKTVRQALDLAINKKNIIAQVLSGYGQVVNGAFPPTTTSNSKTANDNYSPVKARDLLVADGWRENTDHLMEKTQTKSVKNAKTKKTELIKTGSQVLVFTLATANVPELKAAAELVKKDLAQIGVGVEIKVYEPGDLNQEIIRPRKYEALLFGEIMGRDMDPFPFWHSSQRLDPGLNIALYTNTKVDKLLEEARAISDPETRLKKYDLFNQEITSDIPAIFLYSPYFLYTLPAKINGVNLSAITNPAERFANIYEWYINTDRVWKIFAR
ncbi:MAG: ABC transporter substrate-binding protein [Candidatus Vogelbacteria bacterium]|nr:ABC transporter substrate-binding protein [Candidatus Vogelbacteria bacterium]